MSGKSFLMLSTSFFHIRLDLSPFELTCFTHNEAGLLSMKQMMENDGFVPEGEWKIYSEDDE